MNNTLYYGDNLEVLRRYVPDESVDLVYLDPPFNSNASYNVLFRERSGEESPAQIKAFTDTWEWTQESERVYEREIVTNPDAPSAVKEMIWAFRQFVGANAMMAYLVMMAPRLVELPSVHLPGRRARPQTAGPAGKNGRGCVESKRGARVSDGPSQETGQPQHV